MADAPVARSQRSRRVPSRFSQFVTAQDAVDAADRPQPSLTTQGKQSSQSVRGRTRQASESDKISDQASSDSDCDCPEAADEDSLEEGDADDVQPRKRRAAPAGAAPSVYRVLDAAERQALDTKRSSKKNEGTLQQYRKVHGVWKRWLNNCGYTGGPAIEVDLATPTPKLMGTLVRFMQWYAAGRPGDPVAERKGGRKAKADADADLKGVHSAMQELVRETCNGLGRPNYNLREQGDYILIYDTYCSKSASRKEMNDSSPIYTAYTRDDHVQACHALLSSTDANAARDLAMVLYQVSTVARGDDVRPRKLCQMDVRVMDAIGPSQCQALTFQQPGGKTLGSRPAFKSFIRNRLPECCPVRGLFAHLADRFALNCEPMPEPGTEEWRKFLLFPGRDSAQKQMSPSNHERIVVMVFKTIGVSPPKVTHEFRVFPAQAMYEMGVSLEVIQRAGHWVLDPFTTCYIIPGFSPEALLALGFWPGAAQKDFTGFWAERFHVAVPEELVLLLFPGLLKLEEQAAAERAAAGSSRGPRTAPVAERMAKLLRMGGSVVVQDGLELADRFPDNRIHRLLLQQPIFRELLRVYKAFKAVGGFKPQRPMSSREMLLCIQDSVEQLRRAQAGQFINPSSSGSSSTTGLNQQAYQRMLAEQEVDGPAGAGLQDQGEPSVRHLQPEVLRDLEASLQQVAAGRNNLPPQQLLRYQKQQQAAAQHTAHGQGLVHPDAPGQQQQLHPGAAAAAADAVAAGNRQQQQQPHGSPLGQQQQQQEAAGHAAAGRQPQPLATAAAAAQPAGDTAELLGATAAEVAAAAAAAAGSDSGTQQQQQQQQGQDTGVQQQQAQDTGVQQQQAQGDLLSPASPRMQVPAFGLGQMLVTPSGRQHNAADLAQRTVATTTPGGHYTAFFSLAAGADAVQQQQLLLQQQQQQLQQQQQQQVLQQQNQQQRAVVAMRLELLHSSERNEQSLLQLIQDAQVRMCTLSGQFTAAAAQLSSSSCVSGEQRHAVQSQLDQLHLEQQQLIQRVQEQQAQLAAEQRRKRELQQQLSCMPQQQPAGPSGAPGLGVSTGTLVQQQQQQLQQQQAAAFAPGSVPGAAAGQQVQPPLPQQQQQQQHWSTSSLLQQMGNIEPIGNIFQPYTAGLGMSLNTQPLLRGQEAAVPAAAVASMFLQLDSKMNMFCSRVGDMEAAAGVRRPAAGAPGEDAAAAAAPCTGMPPGSWAAAGSNAVHAAGAEAEGLAAGSAAAPAGKKKQQKPLVRAFPTFGSLRTVKNLAKFYFIDPLPEHLLALDGVGPTNGDDEPYTPARADAANLECWRGGRQGPYQRWYEIRFVAVQVMEKVKQLSAQAGRGVLPTVTEAAAELDAERSEMKLTLNKYYHFLNSNKGKGSSSNEDADGDVAGSGDDEAVD